MSGGNEADIQRWMANNVNAAFPWASPQRVGSYLLLQLRQVNMEMMQLLRNNNNIADCDPEGALPLAKDFLYGGNGKLTLTT